MSTKRPPPEQDAEYIARELGVMATRFEWFAHDPGWLPATRVTLLELASKLRELAKEREKTP